FYSDAFKLRTLFVSPHASEQYRRTRLGGSCQSDFAFFGPERPWGPRRLSALEGAARRNEGNPPFQNRGEVHIPVLLLRRLAKLSIIREASIAIIREGARCPNRSGVSSPPSKCRRR